MRLILMLALCAVMYAGPRRNEVNMDTPEPGTGLLMIAAAVTGAAVLGIRAVGRKK